MFVIYDNDDIETKEEIGKYSWVKPLNRDQGNNLSEDYFNWAFSFTCGKYIWVLNDDAEIETDNWDEIAFGKMKDFCLGSMSTPDYDQEGKNAPFPYFPLLCRKSIETLGYVIPKYFGGWGADAVLYEIYHFAGKSVDLREIKIKHISGRKLQDECYAHMSEMSGKVQNGFNFHAEIEKLKSK